MALSLNRATVIGCVGKDPYIRVLTNGNLLTRFTMYTKDFWKDRNTGELKERTEWHRVVCWMPAVSERIARNVKKGSMVLVEGSLHTQKWMGDDGIERHTTEIEVKGYAGRVEVLADWRGPRDEEPHLDRPEEADDGGAERAD